MKNVYKGYQQSHLAVPKTHVSQINKSYSMYHGGSLKRPVLRMESTIKAPKKAPKMPGRNPGTKL